MAFPTTSILDNFDRANEGPPPSANWNPTGNINSAGGDALKVVSNACVADNTGASNWWNASTFGPDCEVYFTMATIGAASFRCYIRLQSPGTAGRDSYLMDVSTSGSLIQAYRMDNGVFTQLGSDIAGSIASGDSIGLSAVSDTLTFYKKTGGTWSTLDTRTDATYGSAGYIGAFMNATNQVLEDFGGGNFTVAEGDYTVINGTQSQLVNVNAAGDDVDAMTYKATVTLTDAELAALSSMAGVLVTADASPQQIRLIPKNIIRFQST